MNAGQGLFQSNQRLGRRVAAQDPVIGGILDRARGGSSASYPKSFGVLSIAGAIVTIGTGSVRPGTKTPILVPETAVTIAADYSWVWVRHVFNSGAASIAGPSTTEPVEEQDVHIRVLALFRLVSGQASVARVCHEGDIWLPGEFASAA